MLKALKSAPHLNDIAKTHQQGWKRRCLMFHNKILCSMEVPWLKT
jgi:hypothetical protein